MKNINVFNQLTKVYLYRSSEVDNSTANFLIDDIYKKSDLTPLNVEPGEN